MALTEAGTCPDGGSPQTEVESNCVQPIAGTGDVIAVCPTTISTTTTSTSTIPPPCYTDTGLTVIDPCNDLEWEKKDTAVGSGQVRVRTS